MNSSHRLHYDARCLPFYDLFDSEHQQPLCLSGVSGVHFVIYTVSIYLWRLWSLQFEVNSRSVVLRDSQWPFSLQWGLLEKWLFIIRRSHDNFLQRISKVDILDITSVWSNALVFWWSFWLQLYILYLIRETVGKNTEAGSSTLFCVPIP